MTEAMHGKLPRYPAALLVAILALGHCAGAGAVCREEIAPTTPNSELLKLRNGTVVDFGTGLMWKRCSEGQTNDETCSGSATLYSWGEALQRAKQVNEGGGYAGYTDWRLPNFKELRSLVEHACVSPAINLERFPNVDGSNYWWTSSSGPDPNFSMYVDFSDGSTNFAGRAGAHRVRLVRDR